MLLRGLTALARMGWTIIVLLSWERRCSDIPLSGGISFSRYLSVFVPYVRVRRTVWNLLGTVFLNYLGDGSHHPFQEACYPLWASQLLRAL